MLRNQQGIGVPHYLISSSPPQTQSAVITNEKPDYAFGNKQGEILMADRKLHLLQMMMIMGMGEEEEEESFNSESSPSPH
ncbi:hypothetical protein CEXT_202411 [Caerostris extrusa]|uniref:Uncharacterized protein n=1 Tax=Caerostris extrusa TaxID=172846 RepID=A0AAV4R8V4_CAEEX|nr:hypothetical protein CEXT_202411 [Caerostris extrusa]